MPPEFRGYQTVSEGRSVVVDIRDNAIVDDNNGMAYRDWRCAQTAWVLNGGVNPSY